MADSGGDSADGGDAAGADDRVARRRLVDQASEDLRQTAAVLGELASAQQRLMTDLGKAVAAMPTDETLEQFRLETARLTEEVREGLARLRNLVLVTALTFLVLSATVVLVLR